MAKENIHTIWTLTPKYNTETDELISEGLFSAGKGGSGAVRELKKRCAAELEVVGKPLVGCAMYVNLLAQWTQTCLKMSDISSREVVETFMTAVRERDIISIIEETWARYPEEAELSEDVLMDTIEEVSELLEDNYCEVGLSPDDFSETDLLKSKRIALALGERKRRNRVSEPQVEAGGDLEGIGDEPVSESDEVKAMRDEIEVKMKVI